MDLTDILFSKPFIGSGSGGEGESSNVETATIEITITDGTATVTDGEFPDWLFGEANDAGIMGKIYLDAYAGEEKYYTGYLGITKAAISPIGTVLSGVVETTTVEGISVVGIVVGANKSIMSIQGKVEGTATSLTNGIMRLYLVYVNDIPDTPDTPTPPDPNIS